MAIKKGIHKKDRILILKDAEDIILEYLRYEQEVEESITIKDLSMYRFRIFIQWQKKNCGIYEKCNS